MDPRRLTGSRTPPGTTSSPERFPSCDEYAPRYKEIARIAAADGDPVAIEVANYMVIHESAFVDMISLILAGIPTTRVASMP